MLFDAVRSAAVVSFSYRDEPRSLDVAGIRFRGGHWYVVGRDRDRGEPRTFRVDRIDGLPSTGAAGSADLPDDFDTDGVFAREPWHFGSGDAMEVDVSVDAAEASRVVTALGPDAVVARSDDGGVVLRLVVTDV